MIRKHSYYQFCKPVINRFLQFNNSNRPHIFHVFSTLLLTLLLFSSLLRTSSYLRTYDDRQGFDGRFRVRRFLSTGAIYQVEVQMLNDAERAFVRDDALFCDRSHNRTDVCVAQGDVRVVGGTGHHGRLYEVLVFAGAGVEREEILKPYTRKWEDSVMQTIDDVKMIRKVQKSSSDDDLQWTAAHTSDVIPAAPQKKPVEDEANIVSDKTSPICEVQHEVPAILFSTGGYTGNVYHEFNDGIIPLYITAQKYAPGQVVLLLLEYHDWWISKYAEIVSQISNYTVIDLAGDKRVHCFPEVTVGLHIHGELAIDADHDQHVVFLNRIASMQGFQSMLHAAYVPRLYEDLNITASSPLPSDSSQPRPKLVIISRRSPRALLNEKEVIELAEEIGFSVHLLAPTPSTEMVDMYRALSQCDVMLGVHGAAMTHLLFMRPGATFIQVVPLGTDWAAETYYGEPAQKLGLSYVAYKVSPEESSLSQQYASDDPVLVRPESVNDKGWGETKRIYLEGQDVQVSLPKMRAILSSTYARHAALMRGR